jgi:hypothetical protein
VTTDEQYARLKPLLPADVIVIDRQPEFPRSGNVLVLKRTTTIAQRGEDAKQ